jgi:transposase
MRKLPAAAQEERRRQVIGLREAGLTYGAIAAQVGLTQTGVFDICKRFAEHGEAGLKSGLRGPEPGCGRLLDRRQEAEVRDLIRRHLPDALGLPFALWSRAAVAALSSAVACAWRCARWGPTWRAGGSRRNSRCGGPMSSNQLRCGSGCVMNTRPSWRGRGGPVG